MYEGKGRLTIIEAIESEKLFRPLFRNLDTWKAWRSFLEALYGLPFSDGSQEIYEKYAERKVVPSGGFKEAYCIIGARGGKSFTSALIACYMALFGDFSKHLAKGERACVFCIATDKDQAKIVLDYIKGILEMFPDMIEKDLMWQVELKNRINISVKTCNYRAGRGFSTACIVLDELAFYRTETSANPAEELMISLLPRLLPNGLLIGISTPYGKFGYLYEIYREHYGQEDSDILVWKAPTIVMNPTYQQSLIDRLLKRDKTKMRAEYGAEFREDVETYLSEEEIDAVTRKGITGLLPAAGRRYFAFCDMSGGRKDYFALSIGHNEGGKVIIDRAEMRKPQDPAFVVEEFTAILKDYGLSRLQGDRYAGEWPRSAFDKRGIRYEISKLDKNDIYLHFQPLVAMRKVQLVDSEVLKNQLLCLERKTRQGGRDAIEHPRGLHDDLANAIAGCAVMLAKGSTVELTPEYRAQRLPYMRDHSYPSLFSETAQQERRVMKKLREEGDL
ncbi:MAG: hypothetical protein E3J56_02315 [Candidatus Aminicenantes bacterium]|nr:MAG: hypothetical protein E3J56_02315 [Candidatus Aminicenantes bacterium]